MGHCSFQMDALWADAVTELVDMTAVFDTPEEFENNFEDAIGSCFVCSAFYGAFEACGEDESADVVDWASAEDACDGIELECTLTFLGAAFYEYVGEHVTLG